MRVRIPPAVILHQRFENFLAMMAKGRVTEVMGKADRLAKRFVKFQFVADSSTYLGNLKRVS